jgi:DNA mismatch repair ATPase MutL
MRSFFSIDAVVVKTDAGMWSTISVPALSNCLAEPSKVHNIGHYISIDGRPVSPARGVMKDIVKCYKSFYRANCDHSESRASNTDPFLCMHIRCPPGSYDVNIEPAKDDVLFLEPSKVMALVEKFFANYYGDPGSVTLNRNQAPAKHKATIAYDHSFDLLLAGKSTGKVEISTAPQSASPPLLPVDEEVRTEGFKVEPVNASAGNRRSPGSAPRPASLSHSNQSLHDPTPVECMTGQDRSELHFTMYGTGDEDLLIIGSPPTTHEPISERVDEREGGSASVTNPWSLAKLNAPTRPSIGNSNFQVERGNTIQLMTPDKAPDDPAQHPERPAWARKSIYPQSSLPSPAASSPSPGPHQNPRPPVRRRVQNGQQGKDDNAIVFTQYPNNEAPHPHPTDTIDAWLQARRPAMRQPSLRRTPVPYNEDDQLSIVARPGCDRQERNLDDSLSTQLTEPEDLVTEPAGNSNKTSKPFRSPFKGPNVASSGPVTNSDGLDFSHVGALPAPPPLKARVPVLDQLSSSQNCPSLLDYGNESTSMPLPPSLSKRPFTIPQSLKTELTDILAFEQRKKAAVLHQRKLRSNGVLGELSPEKLAGFQRKSKSRSLLQRVPSQMRHDLPGLELREKPSNPVLRFGPGVGRVSGAEVGGLLRYNGPHQNHYPVAKERLEYAHLEDNRKESRGYSGQEERKTGKLLDETQVRLSEDDPRAYLARISTSEQKMDDLSGLTRTGLKIRRTKTDLLPLETIPADADNHYLKAISPQRFPSTSSLIATSERQGRCDEYVLSGKNKFVRWSASSSDVIAWETTLKGHITKNFKAKLAGGEVVAPEVVVMLTTAIKAHVDAHGP